MNPAVAWIVSGVIFGISFFIETCFFLYKLINARNVNEQGAPTIKISNCEVLCFMGWIWKYAVDRTTNQMKLTIFIIWYIVCLGLCALLAVVIFFLTTNVIS
jgi:hypothetical protein